MIKIERYEDKIQKELFSRDKSKIAKYVNLFVYLIKTKLNDFPSVIEILKSSNKILLLLSLSTHIFGNYYTNFTIELSDINHK